MLLMNSSKTVKYKFPPLFDHKLTILLENQTTFSTQRKNILSYLKNITSDDIYVAFMDRDNIMVPFLTVRDNLLLGINKKNQPKVLHSIILGIKLFKLDSHVLNVVAGDLKTEDQILLQLIRALSLNQKIVIFDNDTTHNAFLINLMPILKKFTDSYDTTILIVSHDKKMIRSNYYHQCCFLDTLLS